MLFLVGRGLPAFQRGEQLLHHLDGGGQLLGQRRAATIGHRYAAERFSNGFGEIEHALGTPAWLQREACIERSVELCRYFDADAAEVRAFVGQLCSDDIVVVTVEREAPAE